MRLITGPAGSGKTAFVLDQFRAALRENNTLHENTPAIRFLVPTSTLAQHLQNQIAREGYILRQDQIQTLSGFVNSHSADFPQVQDSTLYLLVEEAVERVNRAEFRRVANTPGFCAAVARTILEFSSAGCHSARLSACLPDTPLGSAFLAIYEEVDRMLDRRGLLLRAKRLQRAAARIREQGLNGITRIWLDGFHALPDPELAVISAMVQHTEVTITLPDGDYTRAARERLLDMGFREERFEPKRGLAVRVLVSAPNIERETEEVARRILEQAAAGRAFREIGIIVRAQEAYVPLLRTTLGRFGIPARFYFDAKADENPAMRFLAGAINAMLAGWDHAATLAVLRLAPRFADSSLLDRLDFAVREQIPNAGLDRLRALIGIEDSPLVHLINALAGLEEWRSFELVPKEWAARFRTLRNLYRPARPPEDGSHETALLGRTQATALEVFDEALEEAAEALDPERRIGLERYWRAVKSVLRLKPLRVADFRRDVVHVLSAHEARQWLLPVMFVCGMIEKQFPQFRSPDPFFPDSARVQLNAAGVRVRTAAEFELEERALFDSALTRATMLVTLSYPECGARGERNLASIFLEGLGTRCEEPHPVRPQPRFVPEPQPQVVRIHRPALLEFLREKTAKVTPSGLDSYLQCPFQFFARYILTLQTRPPRPEERLDSLTQGNIIHAVLKEWYTQPQEIAPLFERIFGEHCERLYIRPGYHTERLRHAMLEDLERFASDRTWPGANFASQTEQSFEFLLDESLGIAGRIDRLDITADQRAYVIDYKYSGAQQVKRRRNGEGFQGPLYLAAAERHFGVRPVGMFFVGLKGGLEYVGWSEEGILQCGPIPEDWASGPHRAIQLVEEIRRGRIAPFPEDKDRCRNCDARDVCRIEVLKAAAVAEIA